MYAVDSFSTSIIVAITYGYEVLSDDDPFAQLVKEMGHAASHCGPIGGTPVDLFPICTPHPVMNVHESSCSTAPAILVPRNLFCMESTRVQSNRSANARLSV